MLFNKTEACAQLRTCPRTFDRACAELGISGTTVGKRQFFSDKECNQVRKWLEKCSRTNKRIYSPETLYSKSRAAKVLGMPKITFSVWLRDGKIPHPTHLYGALRFYSADDLQEIRRLRADYFAARSADA